MNIPRKQLKSGFSMPVLGIGTWNMGGKLESDSTDDVKNIEAIEAAIDHGIIHIDTAEVYGAGHSEELVGQAIKNYDRTKLFLVSKVYKNHLRYEDVSRSLKASLKRLHTDYLDLYLIHAPNLEIPLAETMKALDEVKEEGLIKNIGVSNFTVSQLKEAQNLTENKIVTNQIHYSLAYQELNEVVDYCTENDIFVTAYRPVERGVLTERGIPLLDEMCQKYNRTPAQIAINWLISQKNIITISKMAELNHLEENGDAVTWVMEEEDIIKLGKQFAVMDLLKSK